MIDASINQSNQTVALLVYIPMFTVATLHNYELENQVKYLCIAKMDTPNVGNQSINQSLNQSTIPFSIVILLNGSFVAFVYVLPLSITCFSI